MRRVFLMALCGAVLFLAAPVSAQSAEEACDPSGTWWGYNKTFKLEFVVTVIPVAEGR